MPVCAAERARPSVSTKMDALLAGTAQRECTTAIFPLSRMLTCTAKLLLVLAPTDLPAIASLDRAPRPILVAPFPARCPLEEPRATLRSKQPPFFYLFFSGFLFSVAFLYLFTCCILSPPFSCVQLCICGNSHRIVSK